MIKEMNDEMYVMFSSWWKARTKIDFIPRELAPKMGFISYVNDAPVMGAFICISDDNRMSFVMYPTAVPDAQARDKEIAFRELIDEFKKIVKEFDVKLMFASTDQSSLSNKFRKCGFTECEIDVVHLVTLL